MSSEVRRGTDRRREAALLDDEDSSELLADSRRTTVLSLLAERGGRLRTDALAKHLVARESGTPLPDTNTAATLRRVRIDLHHHLLPELDDRGAVDWDREAGTVAFPDDPVVDRGRIETALERRSDRSGETPLDPSARPRRRSVAVVLAHRGDAVSIEELARAVVADERDVSTETVADDDPALERVEVDLRHVHLPAMADGGIVEYEPGDGRVLPEGRLARSGA